MQSRFQAAMVLAGVGDAIGYKNGKWEFMKSGKQIHQEFEQIGLENIDVAKWRVSDDTVMHIATAKALLTLSKCHHELLTNMTREYDLCMSDMAGRAPGLKCMSSLQIINGNYKIWDKLPYDPRGGGCGGSMRAMAIGLMYHNNLDKLISVGIDSGRITHNHVNGFMGAMVSALFTAYAVNNVPVAQWGYLLLTEGLNKARHFLELESKRDWPSVKIDLNKFESKFKSYLNQRGIDNWPNNGPVFPANYGVEEREAFYKTWSFDGWAGSSGDDSVIIAYDALLASGNDWLKLARHGIIHGGDNDSTGSIAACWFGALYGMPPAIYQKNWQHLEYREVLEQLAHQLFEHKE